MGTTTHPEALTAVWAKYRELIASHPDTFSQINGPLVLWTYAKKIVHIQAGIDTIRLLQELIL